MRVRFSAVAALAAVVLASMLSGCVSPPPSYVALGDSFSSGPGIMPQETQSQVPGCFQSKINYPHLIAPDLARLAFRDVSCSGAQTRDFAASQDVNPDPDPAPQYNALDGNTEIVTLGIGGNDIGFVEIATKCGQLSAQSGGLGTPCRDFYTANGTDQIGARLDLLAANLKKVLDGIDARSPKAKLFTVGYPAILPETTVGFEACQPTLPVAKGDVPFLRDGVEKRLNATIKYVATAHGEVYVDTYTPSIGHDACKPPSETAPAGTAVRWVEPVVPGNLAFPVHPNSLGMAASARAVKASMQANGVTFG